MMKELLAIVEENAIKDFTKTPMSPEEKAAIVQDFKKRMKIKSYGELARYLGMPKTTIYGLMNPGKKKKQYDKYNLAKRSVSATQSLDQVYQCLAGFQENLKEHNIKVTNKTLKLIEDIKDVVFDIYIRTRTIRC